MDNDCPCFCHIIKVNLKITAHLKLDQKSDKS